MYGSMDNKNLKSSVMRWREGCLFSMFIFLYRYFER